MSGGYAYMTAMKAGGAPKAVYLMRAPGDGLGRENAYQYWDGKGTGPSSGPATRPQPGPSSTTRTGRRARS